MKYDRHTLRAAGEILFGVGWVESLAYALDFNIRTMQRWASGKNPIPETLWPQIAALCGPRASEIEKLAAKFARDGIEPKRQLPPDMYVGQGADEQAKKP